MTGNSWLQLAVYVLLLLLLVKPLGAYMAHVFDGSSAVTRACASLERGFYRLCRIDGEHSMDWKEYALTLMIFNTLGGLLVYGLQRLQAYLPLNPAHMSAVTPDSSFNTAVSDRRGAGDRRQPRCQENRPGHRRHPAHTHTPLFVGLLAAVMVIVGALAFFPALALGPIVEELQFIHLHSSANP